MLRTVFALRDDQPARNTTSSFGISLR